MNRIATGRGRSASLLALILAALAVPAAAGAASPLAGRWSQSSSGDELVLAPKIKLTPSYTPSMGLSLGGSVGMGSATTTVLATELTPKKVARRMDLAVAADGSFSWIVEREWRDGDCTRSVRQEKRGQVALAGSDAAFSITGGVEVSRNSCGGEQRTALKPSQERYAYSAPGGSLRLSGPGADWRFTPRS